MSSYCKTYAKSTSDSLVEDPVNSQHDERTKDSAAALDTLRSNHLKNIVFGHLNVISIRNKFQMLSSIINGKINLFMFS